MFNFPFFGYPYNYQYYKYNNKYNKYNNLNTYIPREQKTENKNETSSTNPNRE